MLANLCTKLVLYWMLLPGNGLGGPSHIRLHHRRLLLDWGLQHLIRNNKMVNLLKTKKKHTHTHTHTKNKETNKQKNPQLNIILTAT